MINKRYLVVASVFLAMVASSSAWAQQYSRPDGTNAAGSWTAVGSGTHHDALNEPAVDNGDYIDSGNGNNTTIDLSLSAVNDPGGADLNDHILRYYCQSSGNGGPERCNAILYDGGTEIFNTGNVSANRGSFALQSFTIPDASGISNYANLRVELTSSNLGGNESVQVSWVELEVPGSSTSTPSVTTIAATGRTDSQATLGGNVSSDGGDALIDVGVWYSTSSGFIPPGQGTQLPMTIQPVPGDFTGDLTSLPAGTTYYYLAYAENSIGVEYATNEVSFTTKDLPELLATPTAIIDSPTSATLGGTVTADGFDTISDCGVTWGTISGAGPYTDSASAASCTVGNPFTIDTNSVGPLVTGTTYYFRSYAINSVGTVYSANEGSFKPVDTPSVTATVDTPSITDTTALLGGDITDTGGDTVTAVGIIWDTDSDPINIDNGMDVSMTVADPFSQVVTDLPAGTNLWFVAYATNGAGRGYSAVVPFTTDPGAPTMDPTPTVTSVVVDGATLGGTMTSDGGGTISDCGVEWSTTSGGPYDPPQSAGVCTENVAFSTAVSGLTTGSTYYFRAYATNGQGTDYSTELSFVPQGPPVVVTVPEENVSFNSADLGGNVTNDGGSTVTQRGIVWDVNPDPELQPTKTIVPMGSGVGLFGPQPVSLPPASRIYFEAYATNAAGIAYSNDDRFLDTGTEPTLQATNAKFTHIAGTSVRITWTRGNGEGVIVVLREQATIKADPQDNVDYPYNIDYTLATEIPGTQNFVIYKGAASSAWVTGLTKTMTYSVAVYEYAGSGASTDYLQALPAEASDTTKDYSSHNYDYRIDCTQCHGGHFGVIPRGEEQKSKCETCHQPGQAAAAKLEFNNHLAPNRNVAIDDVDCGMCHELHNITGTLTGNTTRSVNTITPGEAYNKSFLRANVGKYVDPNYSADKEAWPKAFLHNDTPKREDPHPDAPQAANTPERAVEGGDATTARGYCQVCHTLTAYHRSNEAGGAATVADYGKAGFMQCHDGSTENAACAVEVDCGDCHEHNNSFVGVNNNLPCEQCHDQVQGSRPIITTLFDTGNVVSSHIPNGTPTKPDCVVCHDDHSHDGSVYGLDVDDGTTKWGTAAADTLSTGAGEVFAPHCLSCHDSNGADSLPASGADQTKLSPFINSNQPPVIDATRWNNSGHDRPTSGSPTGPNGPNPVSCVGDGANGCHGSGHGTDELSLLATIPADADISTKASAQCTNCHSPSGVSSLDIRTVFDPTVGTDWQTTSDSNAQVNQRHDIFNADQTWGVGGAISCADCHSPHSDNSTEPVSNPDTGNSLGTYNPANYGGGLDPSFNATEPDMIEFCTACHGEDKDPGTTTVWEGAGSSVMSTDLLQIGGAGGTYTADFHGTAFGGSGGNGFLKPPYTVDTAYAAMQCTDCHGAHGSPNIFNLKSSITINGTVMQTGGWDTGKAGDIGFKVTTNYDLADANGGTQDDHQWGAWCSFCHQMEAHGLAETKTCTGGHMHGGGKM